MATCKDCVHVEVCCSYLSTVYNKCKLATPDFKLLKNIECDECQHFKTRSRFVELPPDGMMYGVLNGKPIELSNFISPPKGNELFILSPETVNVPFYKNREKAEQALKEHETDE